jgi:glutamyl-tRNA reductase
LILGAGLMITCLSISHKTSSLQFLESVKVQNETEVMSELCSDNVITECVLLQTCNRVEFFCVVDGIKKQEAIQKILKFWSTKSGVSFDLINKAVSIHFGTNALMHLFYLASGIESMVVGEDQILGQVRKAYFMSKKNGTVGVIFDKVFLKAIKTGRLVRTKTNINRGSVSISSAAIDLAEKELGNLASAKVLIIGAGEAGSLAAEALKNRGTSELIIANRTYKKSLTLAEKISGKAIKFDDMPEVLPTVDLVIAAVSVTKPVLTEQQMATAIFNTKTNKKVLIDISQPRALEKNVGLLQGVCLKSICDLRELLSENMRNRQIEAELSKIIISKELERFELELSKLCVAPLISEICRKFNEIRQKELLKLLRKLGESDEKKLELLERFSQELTERIAKIPIEELRKAALDKNGELISAAQQLFDIGSC